MMMVVILRDESRVETVVRALVELGMFDSTVLDGESVETLAVRTVPLFEAIGGWFGESRAYNRALIVALDDRREADAVVDLCRRDGLDLADPATACVLLLPAERYRPQEAEGGRDAAV